jgi:hypothetical protein
MQTLIMKKPTLLPMQQLKHLITSFIGKGEANAKNNKEIREYLTSKGLKVGESELRKIIEEIRENPLTDDILLANTIDGYYFDENEAQAKAYMEALSSRAVQIFQTLSYVRRQYERKYRRSASLFLEMSAVKTELKELGFVFQGENIYWHPKAKFRLLFAGGRMGVVSDIYDCKIQTEFFTMDELKSYIAQK